MADGSLRPLALEAVELVRQWLAERPEQSNAGAKRLAELLRAPGGLDFAVRFVDGVARPHDLSVAARNLAQLAPDAPSTLPFALRAAIRAGGVAGPAAPWAVVPAARAVLRRLVGHLVVDHTTDGIGPALARLRATHPQTGVTPRLNLNLLGEAVLGDEEADRRLAGVRALLERDDVDYVSIKVSSIVSGLTMWAFDDAVTRVVERLVPLYELAAAGPTPKFINLDMEEYRDLDLTIAVFKKVLARPSLHRLEAGIVLQAYLPDALDALQGVTEWAQQRRAAGGASIKVRIVKGANLAMERVDATIHGWPLATWPSKHDTDVNYKRLLDWALTAEHTNAVRIGVAGHNLFDVAFAWLLARRRGVARRIDVEMLLGMAAEQDAVARTTGTLTLYTPVVRPDEFEVAIAYLVRRLEENGSSDNFMSAMFDLATDASLFDRERQRFLAAVDALDAERLAAPSGLAPLPNRVQDRGREWRDDSATALLHPRVAPIDPAAEAAAGDGLTRAVLGLARTPAWELWGDSLEENPAGAGAGAGAAVDEGGDAGGDADREPTANEAPATAGNPDHPDAPAPGDTMALNAVAETLAARATMEAASDRARFRNDADTDPALPANRAWGRRITAGIPGSDLGIAAVMAAKVTDAPLLDRIIARVREAGRRWGALSGFERAVVLDQVGHALGAHRGELIEVMAAETGKTIAEGDPEVSEAADFAHYYATLARELDTVQGARFVPVPLTVVTPPWNFPVSIPAGGVLSALAAGSGVILKPAPQARRSAAVLVDAMHEAGVPRDLLVLLDVEEGELSRRLITDRRVGRVILTGSFETAALFTSWRPDLALLAETSGKNAIVVTPSADVDLAVADLVASAFGHAGQKCSAASLAILVGSVGTDRRFLRQLVDAVTGLRVGHPSDPAVRVGPLISAPQGKLLEALTTLEPGESWLVEPRPLDGEGGRLWSPGVKTGVAPGSTAHLTEFFGPVLSIMTARTLDEAILLQNAVEYGLTAGLHSLDADEIAHWVDAVEAGNLYVNRAITGAIVQRQPFGGWKRSSVGPAVKAGGPSTLFPLGSWAADAGAQSSSLHLRGLSPAVTELIEAGQSALGYEDFDLVRRSALSDAIAAATEYETVTDAAGLGIERNLLRYLPVPVSIRAGSGATLPELLRILAAATLARSPYDLSVADELPDAVAAVLAAHEVPVVVESDDDWHVRLTLGAVSVESGEAFSVGQRVHRIRLVGGDATDAAIALRGDPDVAIYAGEVTASGRVELLPFYREQAISITNHRFGTPSHLTDALF